MDKTLTFISSNYFSNSLENTYPISIASQNKNHDDVEKIFVDELNELKSNKTNIFYSKALNKNVYVYFELIACLEDQLERRIINYILEGADNFGLRIGNSTNMKQIKKLTIMYTLYK